MEKKASLQESVSVQEQYEKLLQDYADFLDTAEDKLKTEQISARDLDHLKEQLIAHKVCFDIVIVFHNNSMSFEKLKLNLNHSRSADA